MRLAVSALIFFLAFALPFAIRALRAWRWGLPVRITIDPAAPRAAALASYLAEVAARLDERPERMRLVINASNSADREISLDWERTRQISVCVEGEDVHLLDLRNRWIPDHPVPLSLRPRSFLLRRKGVRVLYIDPVDANRFRVSTSPTLGLSPVILWCSMVVGTLALVFVVPELLALSVGISTGCFLAASPILHKGVLPSWAR